MELLVAYQDDPAGNNMANFLSQKMKKDGAIVVQTVNLLHAVGHELLTFAYLNHSCSL